MEKNTGFLLRSLSELGNLQEVNGLWFNKKEFNMDGYRFIGCRFDSCTLHVNTTNFELIECHLDSNTIVTYGSDLLKIIKLFNLRNEFMYAHAPVFAPTRNLNNTISIRTL